MAIIRLINHNIQNEMGFNHTTRFATNLEALNKLIFEPRISEEIGEERELAVKPIVIFAHH